MSPRRRPSPRKIRLRRFTALGVVGGIVALLLFLGPLKSSDESTTQAGPPVKDPNAKEAALLDAKESALKKQLAAKEAAAAAARKQDAAEAARTARSSGGSGNADFSKFASTLPGQVGIAYAPVGRSQPTTAGSLSTGSAWSTIKLALALRTTNDAGGPSGLSSGSRDAIARALEASDNAAAMTLWNGLVSSHGGASGAASAMNADLRKAGDSSTNVSTVGRASFSPYGQTDWSLAGQTQFTAALAGGCLAKPATTDYLLGEMGKVESDQRWGLGSTSLPAEFKGGWGPGTDGKYLVRQTGILSFGSGKLVVSIATIPSDGTFNSGTAILSQMASWAADHLKGAAASGC